MTRPLFLAEFPDPHVGGRVFVEGEEARHAHVKRIALGEQVLVADGHGVGVGGPVVELTASRVTVAVEEILRDEHRRRITAVQALAKGERATLAVQMLTEMGASRIIAWQAQRSIVRWQAERREKSLAKWAATARESAKQARRLTIPEVRFCLTNQLLELLDDIPTVLVCHEDARCHIRDVQVPGDAAIIVGPEGGIAPEELDAFLTAGAVPVRIANHVLRTSTAGAVALGQLELL